MGPRSTPPGPDAPDKLAAFVTMRVNAACKRRLQDATRGAHYARLSSGLRALALAAAAAPPHYAAPRGGGEAARGGLEVRIYVTPEEHQRLDAAAAAAHYRWTSDWLLDLYWWALTVGPWAGAAGAAAPRQETAMQAMPQGPAAGAADGIVLAFPQNKGGSGKSTTAENLGAEFARRGYAVLLVDLDPQADLSSSLGIETDADDAEGDLEDEVPGRNLFTVLSSKGRGSLADLVVPTRWPGLSVVPGTFYMNDLEATIGNKYGREYVLVRALAALRTAYDFILLDCPSWMGLITRAAIVAADGVLVPVQAQPRSLRASIRTLDVVEETREEMQAQRQVPPEVLGLLLTMRQATTVGRRASEALRRRYGALVLATEIPHRARVTEDMVYRAPLWTFAPRDDATRAYEALAEEVLARLQRPAAAPAAPPTPPEVRAHAH